MPPKKQDNLDFTPPQQDPYILMKQQYEFILQRLVSIEQQVANLQETWNRILNVAQEQPLRPPQQFQQQPFVQPYQQTYGQVGGQEPTKDIRPKWEKEKEKEKEVEKPKKRKLGKGTILIFAAVVILIIVYMYFKSKGYGCAMPAI